MIRDAVIHLINEQPLQADLYALPTPADAALVCTNLRTMAGDRPVFVDHIGSVFFFPMTHVRFVEMSPREAEPDDQTRTTFVGRAPREPEPEPVPPPPEADLEIDEDLLRRVREL